MSRHLLWVVCCGSAAVAWGQELPLPAVLPERLPVVDPLWGKPGRPRRSSGKLDLEKLNQELLRLKAARLLLSNFREGTQREIDTVGDDNSADLSRLRLQLEVLLSKLALTPPKSPAGPPKDPGEPLQGPFPSSHPLGKAVPGMSPLADPLSLAQVQFQAKDYGAALQAYRQVDLTGVRAQEREPLRYLMAVCLKRMGKTDEAAALFREVASSKTDDVVAACAQWQVGLIQWQRDVVGQLAELQKRQKALEKQP